MPHALDRCRSRLSDAGLNPDATYALATRCAAAFPDYDVAVLMFRLGRVHGDDRDDVLVRGSNGDTVWAIGRHGHLATVMFRRSNQPSTPDAFGVDRVVRMKVA